MKSNIQRDYDILVVDDQPENIKVIKDILVEAGYSVAIATNGSVALKRLELFTPRIILLDINMPGMNGLEVCAKLKADSVLQSIPVIFVTVFDDVDNITSGFKLGAVDYITKPLSKEELLARLKTHLRIADLTLNLESKVEERTKEVQEAKQKAEENEKRYRNLFAHNPVSLWEADFSELKLFLDNRKIEVGDLVTNLKQSPEFVSACVDKIIVNDINATTLQLFKAKDKEQFISRLDITFNEKSFEVFRNLLVAIANGKREFTEETEYVDYYGETIFAIVQIVAYDNYKNCIVSITDISKQKLAENELQIQNMEYATLNEEYKTQNEELLVAKDMAEESDRLKTEFIRNMSHEIRTPLNGILGFSAFLNHDNLSEKNREKYVGIIQNCGNQLLGVVDDILEISMLGTNQVEIYEKETSLNKLLDELFAIFEVKAKKKELEFNLFKGLPDKESTILVDETKLTKILNNLLENAFKFTEQGSVTFGYRQSCSEIEIYVKDTGIGIRPENQEVVFKRFSQEEKELSNKVGGIGLGLSIAKENAELLGGSIRLQSDKGKGATFFVRIPYKVADSIPDIIYTKQTPSNENAQKRSFNALIVEDELINYEFLVEALGQSLYDYQIFYAKNGKEAIEICQEHPEIDFVLMDLKMPVLNGFDATKKIKELRPSLTVIAQTAYTVAEDKNKALEAGCDDVISKPIDAEKLGRLLEKYLVL